MMEFKLSIILELTNRARLTRTVQALLKDDSETEMSALEQAELANLLSCIRGQAIISRTVKWTRLN